MNGPGPDRGAYNRRSRLHRNDGYASVWSLGGWKLILPAMYVVLCLALNAGGAWVQAADDHGNYLSNATNLPLGSSVAGRIDPGDDRDVFRLDLSRQSGSTDVWIYATGDLNTDGWLYDNSGNLIVANGAGLIGNQRTNFHLRWVLARGVYYLAVRSPCRQHYRRKANRGLQGPRPGRDGSRQYHRPARRRA